MLKLNLRCFKLSQVVWGIVATVGLYGGMAGSVLAQAQYTTTRYGYDAVGDLATVTDPLGNVTQYSYDALNRRITVVDANAGITRLSYNAQSQLVGVTDPRNLVTTYQVSGLGNQTALISPDTGTTNRTFDAAGNLLTSTDNKAQTTSYSYDVMGRLEHIDYADGQTITYIYDQGANAIGHLSEISDSSGTTAYNYDQYGQVVSDIRVINSGTYTTNYTYDNASQLATLNYPSGRQLVYGRDALGRINHITSIKDGNQVTLIANVIYAPTGRILSLVNGAGNVVQYTTDLDGRTSSYSLNQQTRSLSYDAGSRLTSRVDPTLRVAYGYDMLNRLTSAISDTSSFSYTYDAVGNRTSIGDGETNTQYSYGIASNQLIQIAGIQVNTVQSDANGSITSNVSNQFTYDARGRMVAAQTSMGAVQYQINALGQRVVKMTPLTTTVFNYDLRGNLIGESNGNTDADTIYLNDMPVAHIVMGNSSERFYYVTTDQLNTPRLITDADGNTVWQWDGEPFGNTLPQAEVTGAGLFTFNLRFPGQYYDAETGLNQNYMRDYDPNTGRYVESDPIGLYAGQSSTYSYALGNPIMFRDPLGLDVTMTCRPVAAAGYLGLSAPVHCGVFVYHPVKSCDGTTTNSIDSQFSVPGGGQSPTTDPNNQTYLDDRNAFFNPGGNNTNYPISVPNGMTSGQFDLAVTNSGNTYSQGPYGLFGQNSNTAANNIIQNAGGSTPIVPGAIGQQWGNNPVLVLPPGP